MDIKVLGACCKKSLETFENTKYGIMSKPALVIDNKVLSYGKYLKVEDVKKIIESIVKY